MTKPQIAKLIREEIEKGNEQLEGAKDATAFVQGFLYGLGLVLPLVEGPDVDKEEVSTK